VILKIPGNTQIYEGQLATFWLDGDGILYAKSKKSPRTLENQKETYELIRKISGYKKVCMLSEATNSSAMDKETRDYISIEMPNTFKAMAVTSNSSLGTFISNIFLGLKHQPIPIKMFSIETEAKKWLMQYL
jgi:hypothetical protein